MSGHSFLELYDRLININHTCTNSVQKPAISAVFNEAFKRVTRILQERFVTFPVIMIITGIYTNRLGHT